MTFDEELEGFNVYIAGKAKEAFSRSYMEALECGSNTAISKEGKVVEQWLCDELIWEDIIADIPPKCYIEKKIKERRR